MGEETDLPLGWMDKGAKGGEEETDLPPGWRVKEVPGEEGGAGEEEEVMVVWAEE